MPGAVAQDHSSRGGAQDIRSTSTDSRGEEGLPRRKTVKSRGKKATLPCTATEDHLPASEDLHPLAAAIIAVENGTPNVPDTVLKPLSGQSNMTQVLDQ